jgi:hypothetical protein
MATSKKARENYNEKRRLARLEDPNYGRGEKWKVGTPRSVREDKLINKHSQERPFTVEHPLDPDMDIDELIKHRKRVFALKDAAELSRKLVNVEVNIDGPYGILHFGDPHVDDDGTDWNAIERDIRIVKKTTGLFAANVGDTTNNWVGRLGHLYGQQSTTAKQAWMLAEHFFNELGDNLLYVIAGNHDAWSGGGDPLKWIARKYKQVYEMSGIRIALNQKGSAPVMVNARHDFAGNSQWNDVHGPVKAGKLDGYRDDIYVCGHKHKSGYANMKDPGSEKVIHCIQLASYKRWDRYAVEKGFRDLAISPSCVTVINPKANDHGKIQVFWDSQHGADYLKWLRGKK